MIDYYKTTVRLQNKIKNHLGKKNDHGEYISY